MTLPRTPSFRLDSRRALVAGASSGIGAACAVALGEAGAEVTLCARRETELQSIAAEMAQAGMRAQTLTLDISDVAAAESALAALPAFDILVNSAGTARHCAAIETTADDFDLVADLNFRAAYFLTRKVAARLLSENKPGSLINISSQMGHVGGIDRAVYAATKHALEGMTKSMAVEWGPHGIRVNTIAPTFIRTPMSEPTFSIPERAEWIASKIKLGRIGEVTDIMGAVVFLASDAAAMITGTSLLVDGGWTAE
jgi:NAD(P)-dependent dehydrogenase (short-subunit alcohol dehydrogenase family)